MTETPDTGSVFSAASSPNESTAEAGTEEVVEQVPSLQDLKAQEAILKQEIKKLDINLNNLKSDLRGISQQKDEQLKAIAAQQQMVDNFASRLQELEAKEEALRKSYESADDAQGAALEEDLKYVTSDKEQVTQALTEHTDVLSSQTSAFESTLLAKEAELAKILEDEEAKKAQIEGQLKDTVTAIQTMEGTVGPAEVLTTGSKVEDPQEVRENRKTVLNAMKDAAAPERVTAGDGVSELRGVGLTDRQLGESYWATLMIGKVSANGQEVVVKSIDYQAMDQPSRRHIDTNTHKILSLLYSAPMKNIVNIYDWFILNDTSFVIIEEVLVYNFEFIIKQCGPLQESELKRYAKGLADAMYYLYASGIAHQNISPRNVYLKNTGPNKEDKIVKLSALEYALIYWNEDKDEPYLHQVVHEVKAGKYVPPEVASRQAYEPGKADVYSYGTFLFFMSIGKFPYDNEVPESVDEQWETKKQEYDNKISGPGRDLVQKCLMVNPADRIATPEIVKHPWFSDLP